MKREIQYFSLTSPVSQLRFERVPAPRHQWSQRSPPSQSCSPRRPASRRCSRLQPRIIGKYATTRKEIKRISVQTPCFLLLSAPMKNVHNRNRDRRDQYGVDTPNINVER